MTIVILDWFINMTIYITSHNILTNTTPYKTPLLRKDTIIGFSRSPTNGDKKKFETPIVEELAQKIICNCISLSPTIIYGENIC